MWHKDLSDWKCAGEVEELRDVFEQPPPIPRRVVGTPVNQATQVTEPPSAKGSFVKKSLVVGGSIFGALIGIIAVKVFSVAFIWPAALIGITWFVLSRCKVELAAIPMLSFVIGQTLWMMAGYSFLYLRGHLEDWWFLVDVALVTGISIWFFLAKSRPAVIGVLVYQICSLGSGLLLMSKTSVIGLSSQQLALAQTMHIILRILGIVFCVYALMKLGKARSETRSEITNLFE